MHVLYHDGGFNYMITVNGCRGVVMGSSSATDCRSMRHWLDSTGSFA
jgi:hypothetical protein